MRQMHFGALLALPIMLLAACGKEAPEPPKRVDVLIVTPKVPNSILVDTTGTEDTERAIFVIPVSGDSVARYYRAILGNWGWELENDRSSGDLIDLVARKGPRGNSTLWIHIERQDTLSARYTLIASTPTTPPTAAPDSATAVPAPDSAAPVPPRRSVPEPGAALR